MIAPPFTPILLIGAALDARWAHLLGAASGNTSAAGS